MRMFEIKEYEQSPYFLQIAFVGSFAVNERGSTKEQMLAKGPVARGLMLVVIATLATFQFIIVYLFASTAFKAFSSAIYNPQGLAFGFIAIGIGTLLIGLLVLKSACYFLLPVRFLIRTFKKS